MRVMRNFEPTLLEEASGYRNAPPDLGSSRADL